MCRFRGGIYENSVLSTQVKVFISLLFREDKVLGDDAIIQEVLWGVPMVGTMVTNPTSFQEDVGLIPPQWVRDLVLPW